MFVIDTNVLIYAIDRDATDHVACRGVLERCRKQAEPWYLTWGIAYEFLRVTTHPAIFRQPLVMKEAWAFLEAVFASPGLGMLLETERHAHVAAEVFSETPQLTGNLVFDAHTAVLMRENGVRAIYTYDGDFNRFAFIDVLDPSTGQRRTAARRRR
ncbi:MAG: PIN domain-containing protein [Planctomycetota bacterium]|nr:PIN domain-containing protein [Planctomycetota bacterium]MDA1201892.1 PIN domain-containing protein [Planctomycetota bacterium]